MEGEWNEGGPAHKHLVYWVQEFGFFPRPLEKFLERAQSDLHFRIPVLIPGGQETGGGREGW